MTEYANLEIGVHRREADSYALELAFQHPNSQADIRLGQEQPAQFKFDRELLDQNIHNPSAYGKQLTESFFADSAVQSAFLQARASALSLGAGLRLRLMIGSSAPDLHAIHWETLCDPQDGFPLATSENIIFSRYLQSQDWRPVQLRSKTILRALVMVANPADLEFYNLAPVDVSGEMQRVQQGLGAIPMQAIPEPDSEQTASLNNLGEALRANDFDILYLVCHGVYAKNEAWLWLEDEQGNMARTSGVELVNRLKELAQLPRLVVLASCESGGDGSNPALAALGPRLIEAGIPAVVVMQGKVSLETIAKFMGPFFQELQRDGQIDRAMAVARGVIRQRPDWWMPVLFSRLRNNQIYTSHEPQTGSGAAIQISGNVAGDVNIEISGGVQINATDLPIPPPPALEQPPNIEGFVGRETELAQYKEQLHRSRLAVISGMAGIGKTMLAAVLALGETRAENIFWHTFRPGEGVESIIWQLAGFFAWHGQDNLWQMLQQTRLTGGSQPPTETLLDYLLQMLRDQDYLICLDDIHLIDDDPQLKLFIERARKAILAGEITLIMTSRKLPDFVTLVETGFMAGLSQAATRQLLSNRGIELADELVIKLHERTQGNAELLCLTIEMLGQARNPERLLKNLSETADIERFILGEIDAHLIDMEPEVMRAVAILNLLGDLGTRYAIAAILEGQSVRRVLRELSDRFLIINQEGEQGTEYGQHAIVREFYYDALNRKQRQSMHRLAADYYVEEEPDPLKASEHYERAGEMEKAIQLATEDVWVFINQGQSRALRSLLLRFEPRRVDASNWLRVQLALGQVHAFFGDSEAARACYQDVLAQLEEAPAGSEAQSQKIRAYRGLGELLQQETPQEALAWLQRGLDEVGPDDQTQTAHLQLGIGTIHMWLGNTSQAREALETSLALLPGTAGQQRATALENLGVLAVEADGDYETGIALTQEALQICRQRRDLCKEAEILNTLGSYEMNAGQWAEGITDLCQGLARAKEIGSDKARAHSEVNLGTAYIIQGRYADAQAHLESGLELAHQTGPLFFEILAQLSLAELKLRQGEWEAAAGWLDKAALGNAHFEDPVNHSIVQRGRAQIKLVNGENDDALRLALAAAAQAEEVGEAIEAGMSYRILAQVYTAHGQHQEADEAFQRSAEILEERYPYEFARTQLAWGLADMERGDVAQGQERLAKAQAVFQQLGAETELAVLAEQPAT